VTGGGNVVTGGDGRGLPLFPVTSRHLPSAPRHLGTILLSTLPPPVTSRM